jgi:Icc protein
VGEALQAEKQGGPSTLVQLSDLHVRAGAGDRGAARRLEHAVRRVAALQPRPDAVLLSGDLVDVPSAAAYELVRELLAPLGLPVYAVPGNHDDRDLLRASFAPGPAAPGAPVRFAVSCGPLRVLGCDSSRAGREDGALGEEQLGWLEKLLGEQPLAPTLLLLHHPPVLTGVRAMDAIALIAADRVALEGLLERHRQVRTITCGHVHTTMSTAFAGRPLVICPSTNSALRLDLRPSDELPFATSDEPLGYAVHTFVDGRLLSHIQPLEQLPDLA